MTWGEMPRERVASLFTRHFGATATHLIRAPGRVNIIGEHTDYLGSDVPVGAGLSSSAAVEVGIARACSAVAGWKWDPVDIAKLCQRAENAWVGVNSGIMDHLASAAGVDGHALLLDCRSLDVEPDRCPTGSRWS